LRNAKFTVNRWIKKLQWIMAALLAYSHGANDAQKIIGFDYNVFDGRRVFAPAGNAGMGENICRVGYVYRYHVWWLADYENIRAWYF